MATSRLSTRRVEWRVQVGTANKPAQGLVIFEASVSYIPDPLAVGGPRTAIPEPVAAVLDAGGYACTPDPANPAKAGERGAELFTTDSLGADGGDWTWTARPQLRSVNGIQMADAVPAFSFTVPTGTGTLDLAKVQKVPASPGLGAEQAVALLERAEANVVSLVNRANAGEFKGDRGLPGVNAVPTQEAVAEYIKTPSNPVNLELTRQVEEVIALKVARTFVVPNAVADPSVNRTNIQAAVNAAVATGGGIVQLQQGEYLITGTITLPNEKHVWLRGAGYGQSNNTFGTRIRRASGTSTMIQAQGTLLQRSKFTISDMAINGGGGQTVLDLSRASGGVLRNLMIQSAEGSLLVAEEWWNCAIENVHFINGGTGRTVPAVWFKQPSSTPSDPGNTIQLTGVLFEGNTGTDLKLSGGATEGVLALLVSNFKMERNAGAHPLMELERAGACQFSDGFMHLGPEATASHVEHKGGTIPARPNGFSNVQFSASKNSGGAEGGFANVPYFLDVTGGQVLLSNCSMNGNPATAFIHAGPSVGLDDLKLSNVSVNRRQLLLHDERPVSTTNYGSVDVTARYVHTGGTPVAPTLTADQVVYKMLDGVRTDWCGTVTIPSDAQGIQVVRVKVLWYSPATQGAFQLEIKAKPGMQGGGTISEAAEVKATVLTVPSTANQLAQTTLSFTAAVRPGQTLPIIVSRVGGAVADTLEDDVRILNVAVRYERGF